MTGIFFKYINMGHLPDKIQGIFVLTRQLKKGLVTSRDTIIIFKVCKQRMVNINTGYFRTNKNEIYNIEQIGVLAG